MSEYLISSGGAVLACARCNAEWTGTGHVCTDLAAMKRALDAADADRDYWRAQATMAAPCVDAVRALTLRLIPGGTGCAVDPERVVAAVEGLASERDAARRAATFAEMERDTLRGLTDAMRADNVRLRAIVEGRTVPPTPQEIAAHHDASGSGWLVSSDRDVIPYTLCRSEARDGGAPDGARWWPLDASGRPCPWPTPALGATGEGR